MKPSNSRCRLLDDNYSNALDFDYETTTQKHQHQAWKYDYPRHLRQQPTNLYRQYRNITQKTYPSTMTESIPLLSPVCPIVMPHSDGVSLTEVKKIHLGNICRNLESRLKSAKAKGDEFLVSLLEKEYQDLGQMCVDY